MTNGVQRVYGLGELHRVVKGGGPTKGSSRDHLRSR